MSNTQPVNNSEPAIDYSVLRLNSKNDRWSPISIIVYVITALTIFLTIIILGALISQFYRPGVFLLMITCVINVGLILISRGLFRRVNTASIEDLLHFAAANNLVATMNPTAKELYENVRIMLRHSLFFPPHDWYFTVSMELRGEHRAYPISLYNLSFDPGSTTGSAIESDLLQAHNDNQDATTSITLTIHQAKGAILAARQRGVVIWPLPNLTPTTMKKLRHVARRHEVDIQTDGKTLAILLPTTLPYERSGMKKLYQLLDHLCDTATAESRSA